MAFGMEAIFEILESGMGSSDSFMYSSSVITYTDCRQGVESMLGPLASQLSAGRFGRVVRRRS